VSLDALTNFPLAIERYVSFAAFLINSYDKDIMLLFKASSTNSSLVVIDHLLHCSMYTTAGHLALHSLESLAESIWRLKAQVDTGTLERLLGCGSQLLVWLLTSCLNQDARANHVQDRINALAAALLALVRLAPDRFRSDLEAACQQRTTITAPVQRFLQSINIDLSSLDRNNRRIFAGCLKDFVEELKSLAAFSSQAFV
jgi:hypothetical protein